MDEKVVLISGGTSGIGMACANKLLEQGWHVAINGRDRERGETALQQLTAGLGNAVYVEGDVSTEEGCTSIVKDTIGRFGRLDGLVTSAGIYEEQLLENVTTETLQHMFAVNVSGTVFLCKYALPYLRTHTGNIVTIGSDAGLQGNIGCSAYCAAKGAVVAFTRSLALETAPYGVRVNCVCPGDVETPLLEQQLKKNPALSLDSMKEQYPLYRIAKPEEIANVVAFLLSRESSFITAAALPVDGGLTSW